MYTEEFNGGKIVRISSVKELVGEEKPWESPAANTKWDLPQILSKADVGHFGWNNRLHMFIKTITYDLITSITGDYTNTVSRMIRYYPDKDPFVCYYDDIHRNYHPLDIRNFKITLYDPNLVESYDNNEIILYYEDDDSKYKFCSSTCMEVDSSRWRVRYNSSYMHECARFIGKCLDRGIIKYMRDL